MMSAAKPLDVLCFGEAIVDFMPEQPGTPLEAVPRFERHLGGAPANVAVGLARLGVRSGLMTLVGSDAFGRYLRTALVNEGVDVTGVGTHESARTGVTFVTVDSSGQRDFLFYRHPSADMLVSAADVKDEVVRSARVFQFGASTLARQPAREATLHAVGVAKAAGALLSCDPNLRLHLWSGHDVARATILPVLADCHLVKLSHDEAPFLFGEDPSAAAPERYAAALRDLGVAVAVVTMGERGAFVSAPAGTVFVAAESVPVVDTTGAGDGFVAGFWAALLPRLAGRHGHNGLSAASALAQLSVDDFTYACRYGHRVAARTVMALGATAALPRKEELSW